VIHGGKDGKGAFVPRCYFLTVCVGSSVDQHTNNVSLFNVIEQITVPPDAPPPPHGVIPVEVHVYWRALEEQEEAFEVRLVMMAETGLETSSPVQKHTQLRGRLRTRTLGLPFPPVMGRYTLCVDWRREPHHEWQREDIQWPIHLQEGERRPRVTH
jgi:hypothetical protein